jgi:hypothetical protein
MTKDCPVCLVQHDPEIHKATLRIKAWLRERIKLVTRRIEPAPPRVYSGTKGRFQL